MIYCVCRQINTQKVDAAAALGARSAKCVLAHYGQQFNCGKCAGSIKARLAETAGAAATLQPVG